MKAKGIWTQQVEQLPANQEVGGLIPGLPSANITVSWAKTLNHTLPLIPTFKHFA